MLHYAPRNTQPTDKVSHFNYELRSVNHVNDSIRGSTVIFVDSCLRSAGRGALHALWEYAGADAGVFFITRSFILVLVFFRLRILVFLLLTMNKTRAEEKTPSEFFCVSLNPLVVVCFDSNYVDLISIYNCFFFFFGFESSFDMDIFQFGNFDYGCFSL